MVVHNISINVTDADSPGGARRRVHLRSLSDVTPASRHASPRAPAPAAAPAERSPARLPAPAAPRNASSARTSPVASRERLDRERPRAAAVAVPGDPWRKMSDVDLRAAGRRARPAAHVSLDGARALDPWVLCAGRDEAAAEPEPRRGKLERAAAVLCDSCGNESCECWRPRSPAPPAAAAAAAAACTCERSPRGSPARLAPAPRAARALSDEEARPRARRLYKSSSQKLLCSSLEGEGKKPADPLLETTC